MPNALHLTIPEPCHENWQQMTPNEQGRHCMSCQKTVVDFSLMSDQEILNYISNAGSHLCGRFTSDQLNKVYEEKKIPAFTGRYAWNMIVATFLITGNTATAQSKALAREQVSTHNSNGHTGSDVLKPAPLSVIQPVTCNTMQGKVKVASSPVSMNGIAVNRADTSRPVRIVVGGISSVRADRMIGGIVEDKNTGQPVPAAAVYIKDTQVGTTSADGFFYFDASAYKSRSVTLVVRSVGYSSVEYKVSPRENSLLKIVLDYQVMGEVAVVAVRKASRRQKITREVKSWLPQNNIRTYPNPVVPGNNVTVSLNLKETGTYRMELLDASGRLVWAQNLAVNQSTQSTTIPTESAWSRGVYWLRVSGGKVKKVYQAKVLLQ